MPTETELAVLQVQLVALKENIAMAFASSEKAIQKAEWAADKRFESVNEFRKTLTDQTATFIARVQVEVLLKAVNDKVDSLASRVERNEGNIQGHDRTVTSGRAGYHLIISAVSLVIAFVSTLITILAVLRAQHN